MDEHGLVEVYESPEHHGGPEQSHEMEASMGLAQKRLRLGQDTFGMGKGQKTGVINDEGVRKRWTRGIS